MTNKKIIVVEDEFLIALDIKQGLEDFSYEVADMVNSGEEAVLRTEEIRPALVLMDISLRGKMNGLEAGKQILSRFNIPVIFVTAHTDNETLSSLREISTFGFFTKPVAKLKLCEKIAEVLSVTAAELMDH